MVEEQKAEVTNGEAKPEEATEIAAESVTAEDEKPAANGNGDHAKENGDDDDEGESSEEELGELEKPVEILTAKRVRKSVEVFVVEKPQEPKEEEKEYDFSTGPGLKLGDIPYIKHTIGKADVEDLHILHRAMYGGRENRKRENMLKQKIRLFCGWPFDKESKKYKSIYKNVIDKLTAPAMKWTLDLLGLEESETLDEMMLTLIEFLTKPVMIEKEIPVPRKSKTPSKKKTKPKKKSESKSKKKQTDGDKEDEVSAASSDDDSSDDEEEDEKPKKKTPAKKVSPKKKGTPVVKIAIPAKKKSASKKRKSGGGSDDSDDEAPLKKKANKPPTDAELEKVVSAILKDADLEKVTMKNVLKQVYDKYLSFDLTSRKDFIKNTVKELIS